MKKIVDEIFKQITNLGGLVFYLFIVLLVFGLGYIKESIILFLGLVISYIVIILIRSLYFVDRPKKQDHKNFLEKIDASSFPSHHAIRITLLMLGLIKIITNVYVNLLLILTIIIVSYSRIYLKKHRYIDVIAGIIVGIIIYYSLEFIIQSI
ncbi:MAG: phosphatase PAP2 family protein [Candidatus Woesearchaeota archaeon]